MKKTIVLALSLVTIVIGLSSCQKAPEEKLIDSLTEMKAREREKEAQRMDQIQKDGEGAYKKYLDPKKSNSTGTK